MIDQLYKSRRWDATTRTFVYVGPVVDLVRAIQRRAEEHGLTLSRWQTNHRHSCTVTYAVHCGERARQFRYQPDDSIVASVQVDGAEGSTERCRAYRALTALLTALQQEVDHA
jgi:hypothetical protein